MVGYTKHLILTLETWFCIPSPTNSSPKPSQLFNHDQLSLTLNVYLFNIYIYIYIPDINMYIFWILLKKLPKVTRIIGNINIVRC